MSIATRTKDPAEILDYQLDWSAWLGADSIDTSTWTVPDDLSEVDAQNTTTTATIRLSGGTDRHDYELLNRIITAAGQEAERSITIKVRQTEAGTAADATDRAKAVSTLLDWVQIGVAPTLTQTEVENVLDRNQRASTWTSSTAYVPGDVILPTSRTGHRYRCAIGGTSDTSELFTGSDRWPTTQGAKIADGDSGLTWVEDGPGYSNIYDLRQAAYECWDLRVRKAAQFMQTDGLHFEQVFQQAVKMRDNFMPMGFA